MPHYTRAYQQERKKLNKSSNINKTTTTTAIRYDDMKQQATSGMNNKINIMENLVNRLKIK